MRRTRSTAPTPAPPLAAVRREVKGNRLNAVRRSGGLQILAPVLRRGRRQAVVDGLGYAFVMGGGVPPFAGAVTRITRRVP